MDEVPLCERAASSTLTTKSAEPHPMTRGSGRGGGGECAETRYTVFGVWGAAALEATQG